MTSPATNSQAEAMDIEALEAFANSDPRQYRQNNVKGKPEGDVGLDMDRWSIKSGAPRMPKAMASDPAARKFKTPSFGITTPSRRNHFVTAQRAWEAEGQHSTARWAADGQLNNMTDHDRRPYDRPRNRGRGYGRGRYNGPGGGGGRKRSFREYDEDEGYDRPPPQRQDAPWTRLRRSVVEIADSPMRNPVEDVQALASMIIKDWGEDHFQNSTKDLLVDMVLEQPLKVPYIAGVILNLNITNPEIVEALLPKYGERAQQAVNTGEWRSLKLLLRFFASAHSLFEGTELFQLLDELFGRAVDLQAASPDDAIGLEITKIILLTIPFIIAAPATNREQVIKKASEILNKTEVIAAAPPSADDAISPFVSIEGEEAPQVQSALKLLQLQLRNEEQKQWDLRFLPSFFRDPSSENLIDGMDEGRRKYAFPAVEIPATISPGSQPIFPEVYFSLYADQELETVPPTTHLAASVIRDVVVDTINILDFNRSQTARYLIELDCYWPRDTFTKRATSLDALRLAPEGASTWKIEDVTLDAVFSQMLKLPNPEHRSVYYHAIVTEMCTGAPQSIAPCLGRAIRYLYRHMNVMDLELSYRIADWFSHHLSNFDFRWKWIEWEADANLSRLHCRKAFTLGLLDKEVRLSFAQRIRKSLPEAFTGCIPTSMDNDIPEWKYRDETMPFHAEATQLVKIVRGKSEEEISQPLEKIMESASRDSTHPSPQLLAIDAFVTTIAYVGSKSLSHALSFIERHKDQLFAFSQDPLYPPDASDADPEATAAANRIQIVESIVDYWRNTQSGVAVSLIDKLLNYGIILPASVIDWALGISNPASFHAGRALPETWVYELVSTTLGKVTNRASQLVEARAEHGITKPTAEQLEETLKSDLDSMRSLFKMVEDVLVGVAEGVNDEMIEEGMGEVVGEAPHEREITGRAQLALLKMWGQKWLRVFRRKLAAQEKKVKEGMLRWPEPVDPAVALADGHENGVDQMDTAEADGV